MEVKIRLIGNKMDSSNILIKNSALQLGTSIYIEKFPVTKDIGVLTVLSNLQEDTNLFQIAVKDSEGNLLGRGGKFRSKIVSRETGEAVIIYNINQVSFESKKDFYTVELWNGENLIDKFDLKAENNIYSIYNNMDEKGTISLV